MIEEYLKLQQPQYDNRQRQEQSTGYHVTAKNVLPNQQTAAGVPTPSLSTETQTQTQTQLQRLALANTPRYIKSAISLQLLVSEVFLETFPGTIGTLTAKYGIEMVDCPLESPLSAIIDADTAVCMATPEQLSDKNSLRTLVQQISQVSFKFSKIYLLALTLNNKRTESIALNDAMLSIYQAVSRFPSAVVVRQCPTTLNLSDDNETLGNLISQICGQSLRSTMKTHESQSQTNQSNDNGGGLCYRFPSDRYFQRPFIHSGISSNAVLMAHCEFLQLFPTINFYVGALLLHHFTLQTLVSQDLRVIIGLFRTHYFLPDEARDRLESFLALLDTHTGLEMHQQNNRDTYS
jgi:hypothetical protein